MNTDATDTNRPKLAPIKEQIARQSLIIYGISAFVILVICFIFGWRSFENFGFGFIYGAAGLVLFGTLILAGNSVPAQIARLSIPKYIPTERKGREVPDNGGSHSTDEPVIFFLTTLIGGVLLFVTGVLINIWS